MVARRVARAIGWVFVAVIGYHAVLAAIRAAQAASDGNWSNTVELSAIALGATAIVIAAVVGAVRTSGGGVR